MGQVTHETAKGTYTGSRMSLPGAHKVSCDVQIGGGDGRWLRYLQDHATKAKQEQIGSGIGRHWGIIGRTCFARVMPDASVEMTERQYFRFLRAYQRLATPRVKVGGEWKLGRRVRRGRRGSSVVFSSPATMRRLVDWARQA